MGQPLIFKVMRNDKQIACVYYHWSAETQVIYHEAKELIDGMKARNFTQEMSDDEVIVMLLDILESSKFEFQIDDEDRWITGGAGSEDIEQLEEMSKRIRKRGLADSKHVSRSQGLIYISEEMMDACEGDACAIELFDLTNGYFTNTGFCDYTSEQLFEYELMTPDELEDAKKTDIPKFDPTFAFGHPVKFEDADKACEWVDKLVDECAKHYGIAGTFTNDDILYYVMP